MKHVEEKMSNEFTKHLLTFNEAQPNEFHAVLHHFTAKDTGGPHDHPFGFTSHILSGGYKEKVYTIQPDGSFEAEIVHRKPGTVHHLQATHIHELVELPEGECWTLIIPGPKERESGFWQFGGEDGIMYRQWNDPEFRPYRPNLVNSQAERDADWELMVNINSAGTFYEIKQLVQDRIEHLTAQHYELLMDRVELLPSFIDAHRDFLDRLYHDCQVTNGDMRWQTYLRFETMRDMLKATV